MGKNIEQFYLSDLSIPSDETDDCCKDIEDECNILVSEVDLMSVSLLNTKQQLAYSKIVNAVISRNLGYFFIDGPSGIRKTFLYRAILATIRMHKLITLITAIATSGVAASFLSNGRIAHLWFKIPIDVENKICCNVSKQSGLAKLLKLAALIIWDETSMARRQSIEALDELLKDVMYINLLFGGKVAVFGEKIKLTENMRAMHDPAFSNFLLSVGNGTEQQISPKTIRILKVMLFSYNKNINPLQKLITFVFPNFNDYNEDPLSMMNRAILTPKNDNVDHINEILMEEFLGDEHIYNNIDETADTSQQSQYEDFLNSLSAPGLPPHKLLLKETAPLLCFAT
ncbi:uncharacterized protein LOC114307619 [Camellia sinensis]|uniref:uncharacterized protein LOC114307619 n=1 Tax=Camellia sinensis TaxID=4442 RepID=UPI001036EE9D|nr:uncharacterized protein LOC114307619 [Camellia sinensis]